MPPERGEDDSHSSRSIVADTLKRYCPLHRRVRYRSALILLRIGFAVVPGCPRYSPLLKRAFHPVPSLRRAGILSVALSVAFENKSVSSAPGLSPVSSLLKSRLSSPPASRGSESLLFPQREINKRRLNFGGFTSALTS